MITKHPEYWHLSFNEECPDEPRAILEKVEALFEEIAKMGDLAYFRVRPVIERERGVRVSVRCRISTPVPFAPDPPAFEGLRGDPHD